MRLSKTQDTHIEGTFQVQLNQRSKDLTVEVAGHGVVSHAGSAVLRLLADNTGLAAALSKDRAGAGSSRYTTAGGCWATSRCASLTAAGCSRTWRCCVIRASCTGRWPQTPPSGGRWGRSVRTGLRLSPRGDTPG